MPSSRALHRRSLAALVAAVLASAIAWPGLASAGNRSFSPGSVIIPAQLEYQDGDTNSDGTIAAYGLIYTVLTKNKARIDAGKRPITFYWAVEPRKLSHHRCYSPDDKLPNYSGYNDNDGCDFAIQSDIGQPVVLIAPNQSEVTNFEANGLRYQSGNVSRSGTFRIGNSKKVVKYSGGAWIVDATDRNDFLVMLATDPQLAHFHKNGPGRHYVKLHSAQASFEAYVQRAINQRPPLLAIVGKGTEQILTDYLDQAGLSAAFGSALGGKPSVPSGPDTHGVVYDVLDPLTHFVDTDTYPCGALNIPADPTKPASACEDPTVASFYKVLWAADWKIDSASTYPDEWKGKALEASAKANALANISQFVDRGNGLFAEDSSIVTFEGISVGAATSCTTLMQCVNTANPTLVQDFACPANHTPSRCDGGAVCYACPAGQVLDDSTCPGRCVPANACPADYELVNGACYKCDAGYTLDKNNPNALVCVPSTGCPANFTAAHGGCYQCPKIGGTQYLLDAQLGDIICYAPCAADETWDTTINKCVKNNKAQKTKTVPPLVPSFPAPATVAAAGTTSATRADPLPCQSGYALSCGITGGVVEGGSDATRFQSTAGVKINSISGSFSGADCNDYSLASGSFFRTAPSSGGNSCVDYHAEDRVPALLFSQKGNFNFTSQTGGNVQDFAALNPSLYRRGTWKIVSSARVDGAGTVYRSGGNNAGFEFASMRHKDGDPSKGLVVYLSGHQYKFDFWGLRIILNTLLNLGLATGDTELARSEPVGYRDMSAPEDERDLVFQGTYRELPPPLFNEWREYSPVAPEAWRFPYTKGHLRAYLAGEIATAGQDFVQNTEFDAAANMPLPANRTIFTVLGGSAHLGWSRVNFTAAETQASCNDFNGNGKCDLSEKLAEGNTAGVTTSTLTARDVAGTQRDLLGMFVQQVRGHCAAFTSTGAPIFTPTDGQCLDLAAQKNIALLGGIDHSSPAVVGPSRYVKNVPNGTPYESRPVVAYVGGRDGMLHAFYVGGGSGYPGLAAGTPRGRELWAFIPPGQIPWLHTNNAMVDAAVNVIDVFGDFPKDANGNGTIEWTSDLERPKGIREWRTVLLAAAGQESKNLVAGQGGLELFAMDVTDPLKPVLLWHVTGISEKDGRWDSGSPPNHVFDRDTTTGEITEFFSHTNPRSYAIRWQDWDDGQESTPHIPAKYDETNADRVKLYRTGRHDFSNLGFTYGTSIGKLWTGTAYQYLAYIVTSAADFNSETPTGFAGVEVFAIDLITGQKVWQWQKRYSVKTSTGKIIAANDIPGRPALADIDSDGSIDRVYVSDLEGRMWELSAHDGRNLIYWPVKSPAGTRVSLPLFGTPRMVGEGATDGTKALFADANGGLAQQPLTSPIGLGRFSDTKTELRKYLQNRLSLVEGSMGVNWSLAHFEKGNVFVLPSSPEPGTRLALPLDGLDLGALTGTSRDPTKFGVIHRSADGTDDAFWRIELAAGERVYGMPRIVNNKVVFDTAFGDFTGDQLSASQFDRGNLVVASKDGKTSTPVHAKSFAGVLIFGNNVIVTSATGIMRFGSADQGISEGGFATRPFNRNTPAVMKTWELQAEVVAPDLR